MNTVAEELIGGIVYATSAHKIWEDLKERFDKVNRIRIYQLHREITTFAQGEWIVDSSASHHVAANKHLMSMNHSTMKKGDKVNLPTGASVDISNIRDASIFENEVVTNVLFVPDFKFNLLSVFKINKELSYFVSFYPDFCVFQDLYSGRVKGIGKKE
ncbi:hypothetical protein AABB24_021314 [Solanum stoloniferum]|uniref:Retrovirus-related Pol polyprotein from transposon TNT 1-94-like beta-barrel domain-containing protein n=1 Tax=Solanum stoloniferum TaxID=62892 RepID=A0ABD2SUY1_9SOLN